MENVILQRFEPGKAKPEKIIRIGLSKLNIAREFIPTDIKAILTREGIDIIRLVNLSGKNTAKGPLIEIETPIDKIVIGVE